MHPVIITSEYFITMRKSGCVTHKKLHFVLYHRIDYEVCQVTITGSL